MELVIVRKFSIIISLNQQKLSHKAYIQVKTNIAVYSRQSKQGYMSFNFF